MKFEHIALVLAVVGAGFAASGCVVVSEKPADSAPTTAATPAPTAVNPVGPVHAPMLKQAPRSQPTPTDSSPTATAPAATSTP